MFFSESFSNFDRKYQKTLSNATAISSTAAKLICLDCSVHHNKEVAEKMEQLLHEHILRMKKVPSAEVTSSQAQLTFGFSSLPDLCHTSRRATVSKSPSLVRNEHRFRLSKPSPLSSSQVEHMVTELDSPRARTQL